MGELVSLCQYRAEKRREEEAAAQAELDALRDIVNAWIEYMGEPESHPIVALSGDTLEAVTFDDWTDWS